jgi:hypothetical protein
MSGKIGVTILVVTCSATALNMGILILNFSSQSVAAVAGMDYQGLSRDPDFRRAVQAVVEGCKVNVDLAKISC